MASTVTCTSKPEHKLFQAIIMQAFEDCTSFTYSKIDAYNKQDSINWFVRNSDEFKEICWNADFDPEYVMGVFKRLIKKKKFNTTGTRSYGWSIELDMFNIVQLIIRKREERLRKKLI